MFCSQNFSGLKGATLGLSALAMLLSAPSYAATSLKLSDVITSKGDGNINLFKDITAAQLEEYRVSNSGAVVLAIDVNEAADGTEKASSQAVTFKRVVLSVTVGGVVKTYPVFSTQTKAIVAEATGTVRAQYYTAVGDTGANRFNAINRIQEEFDSTITIPVDVNLASATAATVQIDLLLTNTSLGDPEAFYDFSNGFEGLAIVNGADAQYLTVLAPGRAEAPAVIVTAQEQTGDLSTVRSLNYFPSSTGFYLVAYEDKFPNRGDYDFNDLTVAYQVTLGRNSNGDVVQISGNAYLVTRGADYDHDWHLRIALPDAVNGNLAVTSSMPYGGAVNAIAPTEFSGSVDLHAFSGTKALFKDAPFSVVNTLAEQVLKLGPKFEFSMTLSAPLSITAMAAAPFDPYLLVRNTGYEVHLPGENATVGSLNIRDHLTTFKDANGYPFAMLMPETWEPPIERVNMSSAYPEFSEFVVSAGTLKKSWYASPVTQKVKNINGMNWRW